MNNIYYGKQHIDNNDIKKVKQTLSSQIITSGKKVIEFEKKITKYLNCKYSIVCNSGTSAIYLALKAINLKNNDIVVMPSVNFISAYNMSKLLGAKVYLSDVNSMTGQMSPTDLENCCKKFKIKKIKAVINMYMGGYPENILDFYKLKKKYGFYLIEDACHALGSGYLVNKKLYKVGSCKHSDLSTFSLHPLKTITTGEGGIVTTNNRNLCDKIRIIRSHGISRSRSKYWKYDVVSAGFNFRLNDFQCALGISQLNKIKKFIKERKKIYNFYKKNLKDIEQINLPIYSKSIKPSYHLFIINLKNFTLNKKDKFLKYMNKNKIFPQYHYIPIFKFKLFKGSFIGKNSNKYFNHAISLPIFVDLDKKKQIYIVNKINNFFKTKK